MKFCGDCGVFEGEIHEIGCDMEYRDAFQFLVCLGKLKIIQKSFEENGKTIKYDVYVRTDLEPCRILSKEDLIINECPNPKHKGNKRFPLETIYCPTCPQHRTGQLWKLKKRLNDKDTCQMYRGDFIKKQSG